MEEIISTLGPFIFIQREGVERVTEDPVLLTEFLLPLKKADRVLDLGTGTGVIPLILCSKTDVETITGVELDIHTAAAARRNVDINGLGARVKILQSDWRRLKEIYPRGAFPVVVSNPPYMKKGEGRVSRIRQRAIARCDIEGTLKDLVDVSEYLAGDRGRIFYIYPVRRLKELISELVGKGLTPRRLAYVYTGRPYSKLSLVEAGKDGGLSEGFIRRL
ncbi:MAG: methyltransferase [Deltaproteobacteria bacterium]|nr:methyltransferase [Deltaproteobacteria bacterium]